MDGNYFSTYSDVVEFIDQCVESTGVASRYEYDGPAIANLTFEYDGVKHRYVQFVTPRVFWDIIMSHAIGEGKL